MDTEEIYTGLIIAKNSIEEAIEEAIEDNSSAYFIAKLRKEVGDIIFWAGLYMYIFRNNTNTGNIETFRNSMEAISNKDLTLFFKNIER